MKWLLHARENRKAKIIAVDPRYTRTATVADLYAPMRSGTDIAFLGGMVKYILDNGLYLKDYGVNYTNAAMIIKDEYDFKDGLSSFIIVPPPALPWLIGLSGSRQTKTGKW